MGVEMGVEIGLERECCLGVEMGVEIGLVSGVLSGRSASGWSRAATGCKVRPMRQAAL